MNRIISIVVLALAVVSTANAQWRVVKTGNTSNFNGVAVVDDRVIYVACVGGVMKTTNHGASWVNTKPDGNFGTIQFLNRDTGWVSACQDSNAIYRTNDGGHSWSPSAVYNDGFIVGFNFFNSDTGLAVAHDRIHGSTIIRTYDGGASWQPVDTVGQISRIEVLSVKYFNKNIAAVMGTAGLFKWTTDGGETWSETFNPHCYYQKDFDFVDSTTILVVGEHSPLVRTRDRGQNWEAVQGIGTPLGIELVGDGTAYAVGTGGTIFKSIDGGNTWADNAYPVGITSDYDCTPATNRCRLIRVMAGSPTNVWITGDSGGLLMLDNCTRKSENNDSILGYRNVETHQVVTYAMRNDPSLTYQWIATGGYLLGPTSNHFCDVIWGYDSHGSICCVVGDSMCSDTLCVTTTIKSGSGNGLAGHTVDTPTMSVRPNKSQQLIDIATTLDDTTAYFDLIDMRGATVQRTEGIQARMSVANIIPGVYHLVQKDIHGKVIGMQRVVVQR